MPPLGIEIEGNRGGGGPVPSPGIKTRETTGPPPGAEIEGCGGGVVPPPGVEIEVKGDPSSWCENRAERGRRTRGLLSIVSEDSGVDDDVVHQHLHKNLHVGVRSLLETSIHTVVD